MEHSLNVYYNSTLTKYVLGIIVDRWILSKQQVVSMSAVS